MFTFEVVAVGYFVALAALSAFTGAPLRRAAGIGAAALMVAGGIIAGTRVLPGGARLWLAHGYLVAGYWLPALLVARPPAAFEAWLRRTEVIRVEPNGLFSRGAELAYLCCYPLIPVAFLVTYMNGSIQEVSRFWTALFGAGFLCYGSLPWLVSRPPRSVEANERNDGARVSVLRRVNLRVLARLSHGWNTFPSGHVAVAFAAALSTMAVLPWAGIVFAVVAIGVAVGSSVGRYHYTADAVAGIVVGVAGWAISTVLVR
jgi:hypothetical protein